MRRPCAVAWGPTALSLRASREPTSRRSFPDQALPQVLRKTLRKAAAAAAAAVAVAQVVAAGKRVGEMGAAR